MALFKDADEVYATLGKLFTDLAEDEDVAAAFSRADTIVRYHYSDPEAEITVRCGRASRSWWTSASPSWSPR